MFVLIEGPEARLFPGRASAAGYPGPVTSGTGHVNALRKALLICVAPALLLAVLQAALAAMAGTSPERVWPGVVAMMVAQVVALIATLGCVVALVRIGMGHEPERVLTATSAALGPLGWVLLVLLAATTITWFVLEPGAGVGVLVFSIVGAQAWFAFRAARRILDGAAEVADAPTPRG